MALCLLISIEALTAFFQIALVHGFPTVLAVKGLYEMELLVLQYLGRLLMSA